MTRQKRRETDRVLKIREDGGSRNGEGDWGGKVEERLILVDETDRQIGTMEKMEVHRAGLLHRAFSLFVFDGEGGLLLQQRARSKYHSGGLWSNTCCSHPRQGESLELAVHRALVHEMGFDCELRKVMDFVYRADVGDGLVEHEFDHVFSGFWTGEVLPSPDEAEAIRWIDTDLLFDDLKVRPSLYTPWFRGILGQMDPALFRRLAEEEKRLHRRDHRSGG